MTLISIHNETKISIVLITQQGTIKQSNVVNVIYMHPHKNTTKDLERWMEMDEGRGC